ncbi:hypothetical protein COO60DRAFT_1697459 [Scenedesmus sp. NREL 46B-D3]|nr:hypothetical protein COO60DRAFT_1697459 [Scenedesmus sp. NREL 46B-D3]
MQQLWRFYQGRRDSNQSLDELEMQSLVGSSQSAAGRGASYSNGRVTRAATPDERDSSKGYRVARKGVMHARAATKFQQLNLVNKSREELEEDAELPHWVVHPHDIRPLGSPDTLFAVAIFLVFAADLGLNFVVAYYDTHGDLVTDLRSIAAQYMKGRLWADVVTTVPFDWMVLGAMGLQRSNSTAAWYVSLLRLLRLGRVYRLYSWVQLMAYRQTISLLVLTLTRNFALCFFTVHWGACGFFYIAKQSGYTAQSWVGANMDWVGNGTSFDRWIYSMYWSIITFSTVGYGDLHAYSVAEAAYVVVFMFVSIGVAAYFVGTSVLLVVENEKKTGAYRERLILLDEYSATHDIPQSMVHELKGHLQLHFSSAEMSDEAVLAVYPTTVRRRILRHMYNSPLRACWLFSGCGQKFLDALLATAKVELYMPKVDVVTAGDQVNELMLIVAGDASVRTTGLCRVLVVPRALYHALAADFPSSTRAVLGNLLARAEQMIEAEFPGHSAASITLQLDSLSALEQQGASPAAGEGLLGRNSLSSEARQWNGVAAHTAGSQHSTSAGKVPGGNIASTMAPEPRAAKAAAEAVAAAAAAGSTAAGRCGSFARSDQLPPPPPLDPWQLPLPLQNEQQRVVLSDLLRVRALVQATLARLEQQQTHEFLHACSAGNVGLIRTMLRQGRGVNSCDYDGRTGLMLAASKGHGLAVSLLLRSGAQPDAEDLAGSSALLEAARGGHDETLQLLLRAGARMQMSEVRQAALLCAAVSDGDMQLLKRLLAAGANPNAGDYDKRRPLHIAAADGNLPAVRLLVEVGAADPSLMDRWQQTPLQEATRSGAAPLVSYLSDKAPAAVTPAAAAGRTATACPTAPAVFADDPLKSHKGQLQELQAWSGHDSLQALAQLGDQGRLAAVAQLMEQQLSLTLPKPGNAQLQELLASLVRSKQRGLQVAGDWKQQGTDDLAGLQHFESHLATFREHLEVEVGKLTLNAQALTENTGWWDNTQQHSAALAALQASNSSSSSAADPEAVMHYHEPGHKCTNPQQVYTPPHQQLAGSAATAVSLVRRQAGVLDLVQLIAEDCRAFCVEKNSAAPDVQFVGGGGLTATLVVPYVEFVLTEVLKNAMQAVITRYGAWEVDDAQPVLVELREIPGSSAAGNSSAGDGSSSGGGSGSQIEIAVTDKGHGIPPAQAAHMYDYFWSNNKATNTLYGYSRNHGSPFQGIGVGVPMSRVYAHFMGGSIEWETDSWRRHTTVTQAEQAAAARAQWISSSVSTDKYPAVKVVHADGSTLNFKTTDVIITSADSGVTTSQDLACYIADWIKAAWSKAAITAKGGQRLSSEEVEAAYNSPDMDLARGLEFSAVSRAGKMEVACSFRHAEFVAHFKELKRNLIKLGLNCNVKALLEPGIADALIADLTSNGTTHTRAAAREESARADAEAAATAVNRSPAGKRATVDAAVAAAADPFKPNLRFSGLFIADGISIAAISRESLARVP